MIEISHKQAQHLIREGQDRRLPEEQWAILYAHLENCSECTAYHQRLATYERDLHRSLQMRWSSVRGPADSTARQVTRFRARRKWLAKTIRRYGLYLLGLLAVAGFFTYQHVIAPPPIPTINPTLIYAQAVTPTPLPAQIDFHDLVLFESRRDGNAEIYLLTASPDGPQLSNLTQSPAQDTFPAWSPDGEWIAFLSDRSGKNEVYITHIAGSRFTQVTNAPGIEWAGPLEWSYDGKWLGVTGKRGGANGPSFLYLVPLDEAGEPRSIAFTYNASGRFRFSPNQPALAYLTGYRPGGIDVVNIENGWTGALTLEDNQTLNLVTGQDAAFDWSPGGRSLAYIANPDRVETSDQGTGSQIRISPEIEVYNHQDLTGAGAKTADEVSLPARFRAVSWVPQSQMIAGLEAGDSGSDDCWMVRLSNPYNAADRPRTLPELCVEGGLSQTNWSPDGKWLVLIARRPDEKSPALYAMRLPDLTGRGDASQGSTSAAGSTDIERLADIPADDIPPVNDAPPHDFFAEPHVRPGRSLLRFTPQAVPATNSAPGPVVPENVPGWIGYTAQQGSDHYLARIRPDGSDFQPMGSIREEHPCTQISYDGKSVAYLSDLSSLPGVNDIIVNSIIYNRIDEYNPHSLTRNALSMIASPASSSGLPRYECPVWSPDGKYLASIYRTAEQNYLAVIPLDEKKPAKYLKIRTFSNYSNPVWIPRDASNPSLGAGEILLVYPRAGQSTSTSIVRVDVDESEDRQPVKVLATMPLHGWDDVKGLTLSPDGQRGAFIVLYHNQSADISFGSTVAALNVFDLATMNTLSSVAIKNYRAEYAGMGGFSWLPDGKIGLVRIDHLIGPGKTVFERFDPSNGGDKPTWEQVAQFDEVTYDAKWMEGSWVVFSTESGLWALDLEAAQANRASPAHLVNGPVSSFDWR